MQTGRCQAAVVVGMHRSGTSAVAQLLGANGFSTGVEQDLLPANFSNVYGHFEHVTANEVNTALLSALDATWYQPPASRPWSRQRTP